MTNIILILFILIIIIYVSFIRKEGFNNIQNKTFTYQEFKELNLNNIALDSGQRHIPKLVFRTGPFKLNDAPKEVKQNLQMLVDQNPDYIQVYFDDNDCRNFIKEFFPEYIPEYDILIPTAFKADLWRLLVIYKYGGIYNDIGHTYLVPINKIVRDEDEIVLCIEDINDYNISKQAGIHNAFFASYPKSHLIKYFIDNIVNNIRNRIYGKTPLSITGPHALGLLMNMYLGNNINSQLKRSIITDDKSKNKITYVEYISYKWKDPRNHIVNLDGMKCILTKFPNYYNIMYDNRNVLHYDKLWNMKYIYRDKLVF